ncbi:MAG: oligopeptide transporter, OPT family, partial [Pseudomonadota bacterium]
MANNVTLPPPVVSAETSLTELTIKALILGALLSMVLAAANAYIGLLVGLTVSASIPAAAASMGLLRLFPRSTILENNMVQTSASAGESLVAGTIFTIPALVMMGAWSGYNYAPMVSIGIIGGILGVAFTVPLRRALIVEAKLKFPEGVATAEVLKTGGIETDKTKGKIQSDEAASGFKRLLQAAGFGALIKALESGVGLLAGGVATTKAWLGGKYLFTGDITLSPALVGVGYIVGLNIAVLVFLGGVIGTIIGVPLNWIFNGDAITAAAGVDASKAWADYTASEWSALAGQSWQDCRRIGVGAMIVGGVWSLISLAKPLMDGVKASMSAYKASRSAEGQAILRTEFDTPINYVFVVALLSIVPLFLVFSNALADYENRSLIAAIMTFLMLIFGFVFSSVAGYMAGLVGSSNNPISGVTIATVIISALILLQLMGNEGMAATLGPIAVIYLAGLICSAAAIAGDNMQDLKCGHLLGATPWRQQVFQVVGVVSAALVIPIILQVLDNGYGIGRPSPINPDAQPLAAPQAGLMQALASGIFGAGIKWNFIFMGFGLAVALIILDKIQESRGSNFRFPVLAVAVGVYLPLGLSVPIFIGGVIAWYISKTSKSESPETQQNRENTGLLLASGLITGEALMGVLIAILAAS